MWGCHTFQSISTSWIYSPIYKTANKIKETPNLIAFLHVLLFRMKLQAQWNTCRLPSFSYCNPFLFLFCFFLIHILAPAPPSKLLSRALLSRNFYFKSFLIAGTYSVDSISNSKSKLKMHYIASFPPHSWQRQGYTKLTVVLSLFFFFCYVFLLQSCFTAK